MNCAWVTNIAEQVGAPCTCYGVSVKHYFLPAADTIRFNQERPDAPVISEVLNGFKQKAIAVDLEERCRGRIGKVASRGAQTRLERFGTQASKAGYLFPCRGLPPAGEGIAKYSFTLLLEPTVGGPAVVHAIAV